MTNVALTEDGGTVDGMGQRYVVFRSDAKGRTVIPAALRAQAGIRDEGDTLVGYVEDGRLVIQTRETIKRRLQERAAATGAKDVVEQLFADRRRDREIEDRKDQAWSARRPR
jgi:bifunctional DNA-binding transcriptional regulator/antitoxin component of YhaV-PrlF toxin-antitoxin module